MGNNTSCGLIKLDAIMHELDQLTTPRMVNRRVEKALTSPTTNPYKTVVSVGEQQDDIIKNLQVPDDDFRSVVLSVGTHICEGKLNTDTRTWQFASVIPLFKIPDEPCHLTIYSLADVCASPVKLMYDSYRDVPVDIKTRCSSQALSHGQLVYSGGVVF